MFAKAVDVVYFEVTSGHRTAACAIARAITARHENVDVRLVDLTVLLGAHRGLSLVAQAGIDLFNACAENAIALEREFHHGVYEIAEHIVTLAHGVDVTRD